ncbi:aminopeptidase [Nonomuraea sp. NPDC046570]|uniref:aminopeptidase n=1 Tax=Nonomuraea sp. NPDC046570 TaxID=3155255 RepID=UPI0033F411B6
MNTPSAVPHGSGPEQALAALAVEFGIAVRPGQIVAVEAAIGHEQLARATADAAYARGARYVDVHYYDPHVRRARLLGSRREDLDFAPPWLAGRLRALAEADGALIFLSAPTHPRLAAGVDPVASAIAHGQILPQAMALVQEQAVPWCMIPGPTREWARMLRPAEDDDAAYAALWRDVAHACRLDADDPVAEWKTRAAELDRLASIANAGHWRALRFRGPGTDLEVGLFGTSRWVSAADRTTSGHDYYANLPSEEIFTTPDPDRVTGYFTIRRGRPLSDGRVVQDALLRFEGGRVVEVRGEGAADGLRAQVAVDPGASRLGEVALVGGEARCADLPPMSSVLLDENAGSHVALGAHYGFTVGDADRARANVSGVHMDIVLGAPDVDAFAVTDAGDEIPVISGGAWAL